MTPGHRDAGPLPCLLLAEDDDDLRALLEHALSAEFRVVAVEDRLELLDYLELASQRPPRVPGPDLILSDLCMPGGTGVELLDQIRQFGVSCPVGLMTAFAEPGTAQKAYAAGASLFVEKPLDVDALTALARSLLPAR